LELEKNLTDSINYAKILFADLGRLLILIILNIIPIINLIVAGYAGRVIKEPPDSKELPPLENYVDLWVQGLKIVVVVIVYMVIPIILIAPFALLTGLAWTGFPGVFLGVPLIGWFMATPMLIVGLLLAFFLAIILAMAIVNMVRKDNFGKAFAIGEILGIIERVGWGTYILWLIVLFVCAIIVAAIGSIPAIGWILSLIIGPIFSVFIARSASLTYLEGVPPEAEKPAVEKPEKPERPEAPKEAMEKKLCVHCGAEMTAEAVYCPKCGKKQ
jgi:ribosomal protein L40E